MTKSLTESSVNKVNDDQRIYANLLEWSAKCGFSALVAVFIAYSIDLLPGFTSFDEINRLWSYSLPVYLSKSGAPIGWQGADLLHHGDFASLACVDFLAGCSLPCLFAVLINSMRKDRVFAILCLLEIMVLLLALSGILTVG
jgi:hypothetical protein